MNIVLVSLDVFQPYILINIGHLIKTQHKQIFVITNNCFFDKFDKYVNDITLINADLLHDSYNFKNNSSLNKTFRNGFWLNTSNRFFAIYSFMNTYQIDRVIHIENDVLLYYNCDKLEPYFDDKIYIPFDNFIRNICSIMYIPSCTILKQVLDNYDVNMCDMNNFITIMKKTNLIDTLPIGVTDISSPELEFVTKNYNKFNFIFDAAAIGQYVGGIDPLNSNVKSIGYINESCVIKYNQFNIQWKFEEGIHKPFLNDIPIFNLHIHSKELENFTNYECDLFDIVIPLGPNDSSIIETMVKYAKQNIIGHRNIYVVSFDSSIIIDGCIMINENIFPFNMDDVASFHGKQTRNGWYLQQLIKLYSGFVIPDILHQYLVIDSDTIFLNPTKFINENKQLYAYSDECHSPYFEHMKLLHPSLHKKTSVSGISHHMMFDTVYLLELFHMVETFHKKTPFWIIFLELVSNEHYTKAGASEYEIYFNFMLSYHFDKISVRQLNWHNVNSLNNMNQHSLEKVNYISYHHYSR
jgi:hypothetical protein